MSEVVKRLHLTVNYSVREGLRTADLYGRSPIEVDFINDNSKQKLSLEVTPLRNGKIELTDFEDKFVTRQETKRVILAEYGDTVATPVGQVVVHKTLFMDSTYLKKPITVIKNSLAATTNAYRAAVKSDVANKQASIVTISMNNSVPRRAEDVINTLIAVYEEDAIADKRQLSVVTADFIKERMQVIGRELGDVDRDIEDIKKSNKMIDITSEATRTITESTRYKAESLTIENQISVADFIREYLNDPSHAGDLIPMVASMTNNGIVAQISEYNEAILRREKLLENSSERSPVIQDLDNGLAAVRRSFIASLNSHISTPGDQLETMRKEEAQVNRRISTMPSQEKVMLDIMRQQKIKEELFLYLLNKQEETQLNYAVAESNSRTIDMAYGSARPVSPRSTIILGISLLAGLAIPFGILYLIRHARHDHPRPQGRGGEPQRTVPRATYPSSKGTTRAAWWSGKPGTRRAVGGVPHPALEHDVHERLVGQGNQVRALHLVGPSCGQDIRGDESGNDAGHGGQTGRADRPRPAPSRAHDALGTQQQQERHVRLSGWNDHRHRPAGDEHGLPREPRRDLRRHTAAQPHRDAALEPARQAGRAAEGALRLRIH